MKGKKAKSPSSSSKQDENLTIFDAPNVLRELMADQLELEKGFEDLGRPDLARVAKDCREKTKAYLDAVVAGLPLLIQLAQMEAEEGEGEEAVLEIANAI